MREKPFRLNAQQRWVVHHTIQRVCIHRNWALHELHVRTNHVHVIVTAAHRPERVMSDLKAWCTRRLREANVIDQHKVWSRHGSTRYVWNEQTLAERCRYVRDQQGDPLPMERPQPSEPRPPEPRP